VPRIKVQGPVLLEVGAGRQTDIWFELLQLLLGTLALSWGCTGCLDGYSYHPQPPNTSWSDPSTTPRKAEPSAASPLCQACVSLLPGVWSDRSWLYLT
jgi:hypothetical protein